MTNLKLRPYQEECLQSIHDNHAQGINRQLIHLPTAAGKTVIFSHLIKQMQKKTLVLAHTTELLDQAKDKLSMICPGLEIGLVKADRKEYDRSVVVSTIQSARQPETLEELKKQEFKLCVFDEAHRAAADSPRHVLSTLGFLNSKDLLLVGCTATPFRNDSNGLGEVFEKVVYHKSIKDLIELGFLCKPVGVKIKTDLDLSKVVSQDGDFVTSSLASVMNNPEINEVVVNAFTEQAIERKTVCFATTISHAQNLSEAFKNRGVTSEAIHGGMTFEERYGLLESFRNGEIQVLTNCQILTEGWDCPEVDCVLIAKPTQSKGLFIQMAGRGLRLYPNKKDCLILDFGSKTHSLCSTAILVGDSESEQVNKKESYDCKTSEFAKNLPPSINKKLRASLEEFDPLGNEFTWVQEGQSFSLKAAGNKVLKIFPEAQGRFSVMFFDGNISKLIATNLPFEYAFSTAEEFAKANRSLFKVSDLDAPWRVLPISDKQKNLFRSFGYKNGIEDLSRGQAALIISSGVLKRKAV